METVLIHLIGSLGLLIAGFVFGIVYKSKAVAAAQKAEQAVKAEAALVATAAKAELTKLT